MCRYDAGALHAHNEHGDTAELAEISAQGMTHADQQLGPGTIVDWEVDQLIEWTSALNFDE